MSRYKLNSINPCNNQKSSSLTKSLLGNKQSVKNQKETILEQYEKLVALENNEIQELEISENEQINKIRDEQEIKIKSIKIYNSSPIDGMNQIENINEKYDNKVTEVRGKTDKERLNIRQKYVNERKRLQANLSDLDSKQKLIDDDFKVLEVINKDLSLKKIYLTKTNFIIQNQKPSELFSYEANDLFLTADAEIAKGNYNKVAEIFGTVAAGSGMKIEIVTTPNDKLVIKYRKCGRKKYEEYKDKSNTTMNLEFVRYKIRVVNGNEDKCQVYNTSDSGSIVFDFNKREEKKCDKPIDQDTDCPNL